jgi:hypothetical protein
MRLSENVPQELEQEMKVTEQQLHFPHLPGATTITAYLTAPSHLFLE